MKIRQKDPNTFEEKEFEVDSVQYALGHTIKRALDNVVEMPEFLLDMDKIPLSAKVSPVIVSNNGESVVIGYMCGREIGDQAVKYKITIEKVSNV